MNQLKSLFLLWISGTGLVFLLLLFQTLGGVYGSKLWQPWLWFAVVLLPVAVLLINRVRIKDLVAGNATVYRVILLICGSYLLAVLSVILLRPVISTHDPVGLMQKSAFGLIPFQLFLFVLLRNFIILEKGASQNIQQFVKKINTRYRKLGGNDHQVFLSYAESDRQWLERIKTHLSPLLRNGGLNIWDYKELMAGTERKKALEAAIKEADIAILLISADFISDNDTWMQLTSLLKKAESEEKTVIIPVFASHVFMPEDSAILQFQSLNPQDQPLDAISKSEQEAYLAKLTGQVLQMVG